MSLLEEKRDNSYENLGGGFGWRKVEEARQKWDRGF